MYFNYEQEIYIINFISRYTTKTEGVINQAHVGGNIEKAPRPITPEPVAKVSVNPCTEPIINKVEIKPENEESKNIIKREIEHEVKKEGRKSKAADQKIDVRTEAIEYMQTEAFSQSPKKVFQKTIVDDRDTTVHFLNERGDLVYRRPVDELAVSTANSNDDPGDAFFE